MISNKVGFMSPLSKKPIFMEYGEIKSFCTMICENDENKETFEEFKKDYNYFDASYDFVMMKLNFGFFNLLMDDELVVIHRNKAIYSIYATDFEEGYPSYNYLSSVSVSNIATIVPVSNQELGIMSFDKKLSSDCMIDMNGNQFMSHSEGNEKFEGSHVVTSNSILNQLLIEIPELVDHYMKNIKEVRNSADYLVNFLGFSKYSKLDSKNGLLIYNPKINTTPFSEYIKKELKPNSNYNLIPETRSVFTAEEALLIERYNEVFSSNKIKTK